MRQHSEVARVGISRTWANVTGAVHLGDKNEPRLINSTVTESSLFWHICATSWTLVQHSTLSGLSQTFENLQGGSGSDRQKVHGLFWTLEPSNFGCTESRLGRFPKPKCRISKVFKFWRQTCTKEMSKEGLLRFWRSRMTPINHHTSVL